jgi:WD40 repeat protein
VFNAEPKRLFIIDKVAISPDNSRLVVAGYFEQPDVQPPEQMKSVVGPTRRWEVAVAFDLPTGAPGMVPMIPEGYRAKAVSPDLSRLAVISHIGAPGAPLSRVPPTCAIIDAATGRERCRFVVPSVNFPLTFSADGKLLVSCWPVRIGESSPSVRIWDAETGAILHTFRGHANPVGLAAFHADGKHLITADVGGTVKTWKLSVPKDQNLFPLAEVGGWLLRARPAITPDGRRSAIACVRKEKDTGMASVWVADEAGQIVLRQDWQWPEVAVRNLPPLGGMRNPIFALPVALSFDGKTVVATVEREAIPARDGVPASPGRGLTAWDVDTGRELWHIEMTASYLHTSVLDLSPDGQTVAVAPQRIFFSMAGRAGRGRGESPPAIVLRDGATTREIRRIPFPFGVTDLRFSPDGRRLAVSAGLDPGRGGTGSNDGGTVSVFDPSTGDELLRSECAHLPVSLAFSPDGRWLASGWEARPSGGGVYLWDTTSESPGPRDLGGQRGSVVDLAFSADGRRLVSACGINQPGTGSTSDVKVWDTLTGRELLTIPGRTMQHGPLTAVRFTADGRGLYLYELHIFRSMVTAAQLSADVEAADVADRLTRVKTREEVVARLDALALSPELKARAVEMVRLLPPPAATLMSISRSRESEEAYEQMLAQAERNKMSLPNNAMAWLLYGGALYRLKRYDEALVALRRAAELGAEDEIRKPYTQAFLAMTYHRLDQANKAKESLDQLRASLKADGFWPVWGLDLFDEAETLVDPKK